jgi:23S rRNA (adenine2503-C2)-methyltransferase
MNSCTTSPAVTDLWNEIQDFPDSAEHVTKYVFTKPDAAVESVLYRYPEYEERTVICCSTMSGCPMGCRFCGTGDFFVRNLTAEEIVSQPWYLLEHCIDGLDPAKIKRLQIMVMSMGEPVLNKALWEAFRQLHALYPQAALLISTSAPAIDWSWVHQMSQEIPTVGLQFSVHESTDAARDALIPFKKKLRLAEIAQVGLDWHAVTGRRPFFNYCAHDGNIDDADADRLLELFDPSVWEATVSVICERNEFEQARNEHQRNLALNFASKLLARSYNVRVFDPAGMDTIGGGCGQLWFVQEWMRNHPENARPSVGNGLPLVHTPRAAGWQPVAVVRNVAAV